MKHMPQVIAMMTPFPHSIDADATLAEARLMMDAKGIRHLPVMSGGRLAGIVSDRDLRVAAGPGPQRSEGEPLRVRDVFAQDAYAIEADTPLDEVAATMAQRHIGAALVTKGGKLVGVFTTTDACVALARVLRERFPPHSPGTAAA